MLASGYSLVSWAQWGFVDRCGIGIYQVAPQLGQCRSGVLGHVGGDKIRPCWVFVGFVCPLFKHDALGPVVCPSEGCMCPPACV